jgi:hypothetical protein
MSDDVYWEIIRRMTPEAKLRVSFEHYAFARKLKAAGIRMQHPEWSEEQVQAAVRDAFLNARSY